MITVNSGWWIVNRENREGRRKYALTLTISHRSSGKTRAYSPADPCNPCYPWSRRPLWSLRTFVAIKPGEPCRERAQSTQKMPACLVFFCRSPQSCQANSKPNAHKTYSYCHPTPALLGSYRRPTRLLRPLYSHLAPQNRKNTGENREFENRKKYSAEGKHRNTNHHLLTLI
jgi:hypothetical protein